MAAQVHAFTVECPPGTPANEPVELSIAVPPGPLEHVEIVIPAGHAGLTGIALAEAHQPVIPAGLHDKPTNPVKYFEGDADKISIPLEGYTDNGAWSVFLYNTDIFEHGWQVRMYLGTLARPATTTTPQPLETTGTGELAGGQGETLGETPAGAETPPGTPETTPSTPAEPGEPAPSTPATPSEPTEPAAPPVEPAPPEGPEPAAPPLEPAPAEPYAEPGFTEPGLEAEHPEVAGETEQPRTSGTRRPAQPKTRVLTSTVTLPAGGWLPHGARFTLERTDQGQDFITDWEGPIIAAGDGVVVHNLSDKPFPSGFGPHYPVVKITTGPFAGREWYIGHCTSVVNAGQHFKTGDVLAHADQGHVQGGGWCELGEAIGGVPGPMGTGAKHASLFRPVTHTTRKTVKITTAKRKAHAGKGGKAHPATHRTHAPKHAAKHKQAAGHKVRRPQAKRQGGAHHAAHARAAVHHAALHHAKAQAHHAAEHRAAQQHHAAAHHAAQQHHQAAQQHHAAQAQHAPPPPAHHAPPPPPAHHRR